MPLTTGPPGGPGLRALAPTAPPSRRPCFQPLDHRATPDEDSTRRNRCRYVKIEFSKYCELFYGLNYII